MGVGYPSKTFTQLQNFITRNTVLFLIIYANSVNPSARATYTSNCAYKNMNELNSRSFWKLLLVSSILIGTLGLFALDNLDTNISGDGIPNRPQKEPPIKYPWDQAVQIIAVIALSAITAIHSWVKNFR